MERYEPETMRGFVARMVENEAEKYFGPDALTREAVANALALGPEKLSNEEWMEISEFAVNAGSDFYRHLVKQIHPEPMDDRTWERLSDPNRGNGLVVAPIHDLFHAAEAYRLSNGKTAVPSFLDADPRKRYLDPHVFMSEIYVELFGTQGWSGTLPIGIEFQLASYRKLTAQAIMRQDLYPERRRKAVADLLMSDLPNDSEGARKQYEQYSLLLALGNAERALGSLTGEEVDHFTQECTKLTQSPPLHYASFSERVFGGEWKQNRRLFLDEFLDCIRVKPEAAPSGA